MKKLLSFIVLVTAFSGVKAQQCPPGQSPSFIYSCELNFHRPKFDCKKGFWFCFSECKWKIGCVPTTGSTGFLSWLSKNQQTVFAEVDKEKLVFHFPEKVMEKQGFSEEERKTFNVDDPLIFLIGERKLQLVPGNYPTFKYELETTVPVSFKEL